mgnify:CR=1 FL=1
MDCINFSELNERVDEQKKRTAKIIKDTRNAMGKDYTQDSMANLFGYAYRQTYGKIENCETELTLFTLYRLCEIFECDIGYLLGEYPTKKRDTADVQKVTGLSEKSIETLKRLKNSSYMDKSIINNLYALKAIDFLLSHKLGLSILRYIGEYLFNDYTPHYEDSYEPEDIDQALVVDKLFELDDIIEENESAFSTEAETDELKAFDILDTLDDLDILPSLDYDENETFEIEGVWEEVKNLYRNISDTSWQEITNGKSEKFDGESMVNFMKNYICLDSVRLSYSGNPSFEHIPIEDIKAAIIVRLNQVLSDYFHEDEEGIKDLENITEEIVRMNNLRQDK